MMRFLRKRDCYALEKPIKKRYYLSLNSFKCLLLSLSTIYYQFSCNVQKSRARGTTGDSDGRRGRDAKRSSAIILLTIFCVLFSFASVVEAKAQELRQGGATEIGEIKPLAVGQKVPEEFWTDSISVYENGEIIRTTFGTYRGKPLLLDFWATWCSTCIAHMPELYNLDTYKNNELEIFPVTTEDGNKITAFVERVQRLNKLPFRTVVENNILPEYFKHYSVPFYVLLNADGMVQTMIGLKEMEESLISGLVENKHQIFESDLTTDTGSYPSIIASRYGRDMNYFYSFFYKGINKLLGGGNKKRKANGIIYSLGMLNISLGDILTTLARTKYEQESFPYHYSFVVHDNLSEEHKKMLNETTTFEVAIPKDSGADVVDYSLSELNNILPFLIRFEDREVEVNILHSVSETLKTVNREDLSFSILSGRLNEIYGAECLFMEQFEESPDLSTVNMSKDIRKLAQTLRSNGVGLSKQKINLPFLIIGE